MTAVPLPVSPNDGRQILENNAHSDASSGSTSSEYRSFIMEPNKSIQAPSKLCISCVVLVMIILQIASTTGLLLYINTSITLARDRGVSEELSCLGLLNALEKDQTIPDSLVQHFGEPCIRIAEGIKTYISKVTENIISQHTFQEKQTVQLREKVPADGKHRPSAHLTLRDDELQDPTSLTPQTELHQSCRHPVSSWGNQSFGSHLHNMTVSNGRLRIPEEGRYYLYVQVYFRYLTLSSSEQSSSTASQQVVQCVYKKTAYPKPIQLLKGVGTKCWTPRGENALHSIYQGGMFNLRAGDEIFVSVSSLAAVHAEDSSSYFGAFHFEP